LDEIKQKVENALREWLLVDPPHRADDSLLDGYVHLITVHLNDLPITADFRQQVINAVRQEFAETLSILFSGYEPVLVADGHTITVVAKPVLGAIVAGRALSQVEPPIRTRPLFVLELTYFVNSMWGWAEEPQRSRLGPWPRPRFRQPYVVREMVVPIMQGGIPVGEAALEYDFTIGQRTEIRVIEASAQPATSFNYSLLDQLASREVSEKGRRKSEDSSKSTKQKIAKRPRSRRSR